MVKVWNTNLSPIIRKMINNNIDVTEYIPKKTETYLYKNLNNESYFSYLKYKILTSNDLSIYQTVEEGIENRIKKAIKKANSWEELTKLIKTKRYSYNT